ncbi:TIGR00269 family protein [Desulfurobacterium atlanticum]|uniref:TIGR00269 family protein n=1 Tax=Desulfurobacterium atlanticum TaxID=240169 RepID=A0A238YIQ0_9BACT|nr:TIGR00269 family protein [Desulfurobacterium atlanticum]SNR70678.1 TIGR00269 family protein [Desulfurobacterium atlanticum]
MLCKICKTKGKREKAVINLRHHKLALCKEHFIEWFEKHTLKTIEKFKMFSKNGKIGIAVSGGKDSLSLWYLLTKAGYETVGIHISLGIKANDYSEKSLELCKQMAERINRPLITFNLPDEFGYPIEKIAQLSGRDSVCSVCGTFKRYIMNKLALKENLEAIATGHNLDDESAVLLSNTLRWDTGYLGRQYPVLLEKGGFARKVKPFCFFTEKEIVSYAILNEIEFMETGCPNSEKATSPVYKQALALLEHKMPGTKLRFYKEFIKKARPIFEAVNKEEIKLVPCEKCGTPTTADVCSVCRILEKVKNAKSREN